jgi:hypothetical protein
MITLRNESKARRQLSEQKLEHSHLSDRVVLTKYEGIVHYLCDNAEIFFRSRP